LGTNKSLDDDAGRGFGCGGPPVRVHDAVQLKQWTEACCNNVTYAAGCVRMGLHEHINAESSQLKEANEDFYKFMKELERQSLQTVWPELSKHGAPRALGDVFQAVVAAVLLDCVC
jgi:hypothetical protein